jgi:hypothetical protein
MFAPMSMKPVHFALRDYGRVLSTRETGHEVGQHVRQLLEPRVSVVLDFKDVEAITPPFFDELLGSVRLALKGDQESRGLVVSGLNSDVRETVEFVLERNKMALAELRNGKIDLLTAVPHLAETLGVALKLGEFTAPQLAKELDLKAGNANQRLTALVEAGAIAREPDRGADRGRRFLYRVPAARKLEASGRPGQTLTRAGKTRRSASKAQSA